MLHVGFLVVWIICHVLINIAQLLQHIDKHHTTLLDISLVCVSDKIHVEVTIAGSALLILLLFSRVKWILFVEVIKVLVADLRSH